MAQPTTHPRGAHAPRRGSSRPRPCLTERELQAYFEARETLRRLQQASPPGAASSGRRRSEPGPA